MRMIKELGLQLDNGWFTRLLVVAQFAFAYSILTWSQAQGSTALAAAMLKDNWNDAAGVLGAAAGLIGAVAVAPQALMFFATNKYMESRAQKPIVYEDRRVAGAAQTDNGGAQ